MAETTTPQGSDIPQESPIQTPTTQPSDTGTGTPRPADKGEAQSSETGKTYTEDDLNRRLRGQGAEIEKQRKTAASAEARAQELQNQVEELRSQLKGLDDLQGKLKEAEQRQEQERQRLKRFMELTGPHGVLASDVEIEWLPTDVFELADGKPTEKAEKALQELLAKKPILARKGGPGIPPVGRGGSIGAPTSSKLANAFAQLSGGKK